MLYDKRLDPPEIEDAPKCHICGCTEDLDRVGYNRYRCSDCSLDILAGIYDYDYKGRDYD